MPTPVLAALVTLHSLAQAAAGRLRRDERGEGVISAAIAVLVMAFLGVAMWLAFRGMLEGTSSRTNRQVSQIGS
jgi:hypothetical protein